jgi:hypothetical protein
MLVEPQRAESCGIPGDLKERGEEGAIEVLTMYRTPWQQVQQVEEQELET